MNFFFLLILSLLLIYYCICTETVFSGNFQIYDGDYLINNTLVSYYGSSNFSGLSKIGKVWNFVSENDSESIETYALISRYFIYLIGNESSFINFQSSTPQYVTAILVPNTTYFNSSKMIEYLTKSNYLYIFYNASSLENLTKYDIRVEEGNYFFYFNFEIPSTYESPLTYLKIASITTFVISVGIVIGWNLLLKYVNPESIILLQKLIIFLPYINLILSGLIIFQIFSSNGTSTINFSDSRIYIETASVTIHAIFRTIFWFFIILIASGWQITAQAISKDEMKTFIKIYIFIYATLCMDQILDAFAGKVFSIFFPSEIKNIIFYGLMLAAVLYKGHKTKKLIRLKIGYAVNLAPDYIPALKLKYQWIK